MRKDSCFVQPCKERVCCKIFSKILILLLKISSCSGNIIVMALGNTQYPKVTLSYSPGHCDLFNKGHCVLRIVFCSTKVIGQTCIILACPVHNKWPVATVITCVVEWNHCSIPCHPVNLPGPWVDSSSFIPPIVPDWHSHGNGSFSQPCNLSRNHV